MAQDWEIKARGTACTACAVAFADGQAYCSALLFGTDGYKRQDCCSACWQKDAGAAGTAVSIWRGVFRAAPPKAPEPVKREKAESLLRDLMEREDPTQLGAVFILAVMLERKKVLLEKEVREDAGLKVRVYEHRGTGETFLVADPGLKLDRLREVQEQVIALLEGGARDEPAAAEAAPAPPPPAAAVDTAAPPPLP